MLVITIIIGIILIFWKSLTKMLNIPSFSGAEKVSGIAFGILAYAAVLLLFYRVFPDAWNNWYNNSRWFWTFQALIFLGAIAWSTQKTFAGIVLIIIGISFAYLDTKNDLGSFSSNHKETRYAKHGTWSNGVYLPEYKGVNFLHADADSVLMITSKNEVLVATKDAFFYKETHLPFNKDSLHCGETRFMAIDGCPETPVVVTWKE